MLWLSLLFLLLALFATVVNFGTIHIAASGLALILLCVSGVFLLLALVTGGLPERFQFWK